jgi:hypothetical protein
MRPGIETPLLKHHALETVVNDRSWWLTIRFTIAGGTRFRGFVIQFNLSKLARHLAIHLGRLPRESLSPVVIPIRAFFRDGRSGKSEKEAEQCFPYIASRAI